VIKGLPLWSVIENSIGNNSEALCVVVGVGALPHNFIKKVVLAKDLIEHNFDVMRGVPVAMVVEAARLLQHAIQFLTPGKHVVDVRLRGLVPVLKGSFLLGLAPKHFVITVGVERRVYVDQVNTGRREFL
jgi:hypothetical protein